ncbi:MAG: hypothetical protein DRI30_07765 [Chloroflexi bacterium]|nr:MAG: hypothetical protein DRI30_07765 [Chloroflexota bacterium]
MKQLVLAFALSLLPQISASQSGSYCGTAGQPVPQTLGTSIFGDWTISHHAGFVQTAGMILPYPPTADDQMVIIPGPDNTITLMSPDISDFVTLTPTTEPPWQFRNDQPNSAGVNPVLTDQDISALVGCNANSLPRLIGHGTFNIQGTGTMDMTVRLIVLNDSSMFGILEFTGSAQGYSFMSRRSVAMTK